ncbi:MAG: ATP-binding protein [Janthinobacterium lividum]
MTERKLHILIVGGDANDFMLLSNELNKAFWIPTILHCQDVENAVALCANVNFDVLILTIYFLQLLEKELFSKIMQGENAPAVIFLTGPYHENFMLEAIFSGAQDCLPKEGLNSQILYKSITFAVARQINKREILTSNFYQKLFTKNPLPMLMYEAGSKKIVLANEAATTFYGYTLPEFVALTITDIQPESDSNKNFAGQKKHRTKSGSLVSVEVLTNLIHINQKTCRQMVVIDRSKNVLGKPEMEDEMQQQLILLQSAISNSSDGVIITKNISGDFYTSEIVYSNLFFNILTGYSSAEIIHQKPEHLHKKYPVKEVSAYNKLQIETFQTRFINYHSGQEFWVDYSISPVLDANGKTTHFTAVYRNVSARKTTETETENLIRSLKETNQELKQFSYVISHNLRAPLANLIGLLSLLDVENIQDEDTLELIGAVKSSINKLNITVNDIVDVLLIKSDNNYAAELLPIAEAWEKAKTTLSYLIETADAQIIQDFAEAPVIAFTESYLESILVNFLSNALKYKSDDRQLIINLKTYEEAGHTVLVFEDNGIGIDMNRYGSQVFGLYKRFSNKAEGKGLGLYIVQAQITAMGGKIEVKSELNKGTRFTVFFKK